MLAAGKLRSRVRIERPVPDTSLDGAGSGSWALLDTVWAEVQDMLPSRIYAERQTEGINLATRPTRVRIRYRTDVTSDMRFVIGARVMQIVSGPAEIGWREGLEFLVEDYNSAGNAA
jgi:head-tail adaptor